MNAGTGKEYWLARENTEGFRELEVLGPFWATEHYFDDCKLPSSKTGPLDTTRLVLRFNSKDRRPKPDFPHATGLLTCRKANYYNLFAHILASYVKVFDFKIDDEPYVSLRPNIFLDLIDLRYSKYLSRPERPEPYAFRRIALKALPEPSLPIFSCAWPRSVRFQPIVSDEFVAVYRQNKLTGLDFIRAWPPKITSNR